MPKQTPCPTDSPIEGIGNFLARGRLLGGATARSRRGGGRPAVQLPCAESKGNGLLSSTEPPAKKRFRRPGARKRLPSDNTKMPVGNDLVELTAWVVSSFV